MASSTEVEENKTEEETEAVVTLVSAIKDKYCTAPEPYNGMETPLHSHREIQVVVSSKRPGSISVQDVRNIIIESSDIASVGCVDELKSLCTKAKELNLGGNKIQSWETIISILNSVPNLQYLDLNHNNCLSQAFPPPPLSSLPTTPLSILTLSCTRVPFQQVTTALQYLPSVCELHLSKNDYSDEDLSLSEYPQHSSLKMLHFVSNDIKEWRSAETIGKLFPGLETLLISANPLDDITPSGVHFEQLRTLNLNNTNITSWESLESLMTFPGLKSVSLLNVPIGSDLEGKERRFAMISRLPSIEQLNKSSISATEREDAERWLVRQYHEKPKRPSVFEDLAEKHGKLQPLPDIDLSPKKEIMLELFFKGIEKRSEVHKINVEQTTGQLRSWIASRLLKVDPSSVEMVYVDLLEDGQVYCRQIMKYNSKPLYYYKMKDGDKVKVTLLRK